LLSEFLLASTELHLQPQILLVLLLV